MVRSTNFLNATSVLLAQVTERTGQALVNQHTHSSLCFKKGADL